MYSVLINIVQSNSALLFLFFLLVFPTCVQVAEMLSIGVNTEESLLVGSPDYTCSIAPYAKTCLTHTHKHQPTIV